MQGTWFTKTEVAFSVSEVVSVKVVFGFAVFVIMVSVFEVAFFVFAIAVSIRSHFRSMRLYFLCWQVKPDCR